MRRATYRAQVELNPLIPKFHKGGMVSWRPGLPGISFAEIIENYEWTIGYKLNYEIEVKDYSQEFRFDEFQLNRYLEVLYGGRPRRIQYLADEFDKMGVLTAMASIRRNLDRLAARSKNKFRKKLTSLQLSPQRQQWRKQERKRNTRLPGRR